MLAWIDLEMTGLDAEHDVIVEIAALVTDNDLRLVDDGLDLVIHQPQMALAAMSDEVRTMHTESGLVELVEASTVSLHDAGEAVLALLHKHIREPGAVPLCGNSIGMDRRFLARHLPQIENFLHYRSIDVSTIKELARRWRPDLYERAPEKRKHHRALDDIHESLDELRWYRSTGFIDSSPEPR